MKSLFSLFLLCSLVLFTGCSKKDGAETSNADSTQSDSSDGESTSTKKYESPEAVFAAFQKAAEKDDMPAAIKLTTKESQQAIAGSMVFALSMVAAFDPEKGGEIEAMIREHGVTEEEENEPPEGLDLNSPVAMVKAMGAMLDDPVAFVSDAVELMDGESQANEFANGELIDLQVDGDSAAAMIESDNEQQPIEFRKVDDGWLIHIPDETFERGMSGGGDIEINSGAQFDEFEFHYDEPDELPPPDAITKDEFDAAWKIDLKAEDGNAGELLKSIADECGLSFFSQPEMEPRLQQPVSIDLSGVSRVQAIEEICEQLGIYPRYRIKTIAFAEGPRPYPVAFAGPFMVSVKRINEYPPYATGEVEFDCVAIGMPTSMISQLESMHGYSEEDDDSAMTLAVPRISGGGNELRGDMHGGMMKMVSRSNITFGLSYQLKNLLRGTESIEPIKGRISWPFPSKVTVLKFDELKAGAVAESGQIKATLDQVELGDMPQFQVKTEGATYSDVSLGGRGASGELLGSLSTFNSGFGDTTHSQITFESKIESLEVRITGESDRVSYEFTIDSIALNSFEEMPEQLTELSYPGDSPVSVEFVKFTGQENFRKLQLKVTNHSNKDLQHVNLECKYLDDAGKELKDTNATASPSGMDGRVLVKAGESKNTEVHAFFMPPESAGVSVSPTNVIFADLTEWAAE